MREKFEQALLELGVNPANKGFTYTITALELIDNDSSNLDKITALYATVASRHANATGTRVERAIRHMVEQIVNYTDVKVVAKYFVDFSRMTNSKFLAALHLSVNYNATRSENLCQCAKCRIAVGGERRVVSLADKDGVPLTLCSHCIAEFMDEI